MIEWLVENWKGLMIPLAIFGLYQRWKGCKIYGKVRERRKNFMKRKNKKTL